MNMLFLIASIAFFIWIIRNTLFWVALWQLKEYRLDRVLIHLRETYQGKQLVVSQIALIKYLLILGFGIIVFSPEYTLLYHLFITLLFVSEASFVAKEAFYKTLKRPIFTFKAFLITVATLFTIGIFYIFPAFEPYLWLLLIDKIVVFIISFLVLGLSYPTEFYRDITVEKAIRKIEFIRKQNKRFLVIGVTGSYGKSSTKEYLAQILENKFNVIKTLGTNNTPIGIAHTILEKLSDQTDIFVVEMGAYKRGEIAYMSQVVHQNIGILTSVNEQHLSLFGSLENTIQAKYEIIDALPKNGLALFNGNNKNAYKLYMATNKKKVLYRSLYRLAEGKVSSKKLFADITAVKVVPEKTHVTFDAKLEGAIMHFKAPLLGAHNVENILPGIYIGHYLGMKEGQLKRAVANLIPFSKTMNYYKLKRGPILIDDTFNANPEAVLAALEYMNLYSGKKILVLQPMIELGKNAYQEHYRVSKAVSGVCDYVFLTNKNFQDAILKGIIDGGGRCTVKSGSPSEIAKLIITHTDKNSVVVFEGKESSIVFERMKLSQ